MQQSTQLEQSGQDVAFSHASSPIDQIRPLRGAERTSNALNRVWDFFTTRPTKSGRYLALASAVMLGIFALGFVYWYVSLGLNEPGEGKVKFNVLEWRGQVLDAKALQSAMEDLEFPYYTEKMRQETNRFLAIPETTLSPQFILLRWLSVRSYLAYNLLGMYFIGFIGLLALSLRYRLSLMAFIILYFLYNFNGHIVTNLAIGHSMWLSYYFLPLFIAGTLMLVEKAVNSRVVIPALAMVLGLILLQGGVHIYVWCVLFLFVLSLVRRDLLIPILFTIGLSAGMMSFRIIPAALFFDLPFQDKFAGGYPSLSFLIDNLVVTRDYTARVPEFYGSLGGYNGRWAYDIYIGLVGLLFILSFGILFRVRPPSFAKSLKYRSLDLPMFVMFVFALGIFYRPIVELPLDVTGSERQAGRMLIMPVLFLTFLSVIRFQALLDRWDWNGWTKWLTVISTVSLAFSLSNNFWVWRIAWIEFRYQSVPFLQNSNEIIDGPMNAYPTIFLVTLVVSLSVIVLTAAYLVTHIPAEQRSCC